MYLIADGIGIVTRCGDKEIQGLLSGVAGAVGHNVVKLSVRLGVQLVEHHRMDVQPMLGVGFRRKHLIEAPQRFIYQAFLRQHRLDPGFQRRALLHHIHRHVEYNGSLLPVGSAAIDLAAVFHIPAGEQQGDSGSQLGFPLLLRYFHIGCIKLAVSVRLDNAEQVAYNLLLPVDQFKILAVPFALGMFQAGDKVHRQIGPFPVICGAICHEAGGLVCL